MGIDPARGSSEHPEAHAIERLMTADEVAAALGVSRKFVYARAADGTLPGYKLGPRYRFRREDVRAFLEDSRARRDKPLEARVRQRRRSASGSFRALLDERRAA